jgi:lipopolysaccharide transport system ATP-binding protein
MSCDGPRDVSEISIRISNISKNYRIYSRPQDRLLHAVMPRIQRLLRRPQGAYCRDFWALSDVSFDVRRGETLGIIGRNGSGKSTLLQIVSGTLSPTAGSVEVHGRVAALLELGAGFNTEFTGRENVFLNAMLFGLSHEQVAARFDSIATFADIGTFIDQPIKTYSSGMVVRLAFAVLAHVDADILIIDEALAVGDAVFTQKCMRFLRKFKESGTLLFVSHDAAAVLALCERAVWLDQGHLRMAGQAKAVADAYLKFCAGEILGESFVLQDIASAAPSMVPAPAATDDSKIAFYDNIANADGWTTGGATIEQVLLTVDDRLLEVARGGERVRLRISVTVATSLDRPIIGFIVKDRLGQALFGHNTLADGLAPPPVAPGQRLEADFVFDLPHLPNGDYSMTVAVADGELDDHVQHHWLHDAVIIHVQSAKRRYGLVGIPILSSRLNVVTG